MPPFDDPSFSPSASMDLCDLDRLARTHAARLASFLRRRVGNPHDVEDLVQDTLLEAVRCSGQFQGQSRPQTWLFGIALNLTTTTNAQRCATFTPTHPLRMCPLPAATIHRRSPSTGNVCIA